MVLYRCAACGSPNVVVDKQVGKIKYNFLKGALGKLALGSGGAAAGITNETQQVFKCPDCGMTLTYPLEEPWKSLIDLGNSSIEARKTLNYNGVPIKWSMLKEKYANIEEGAADREIEYNKVLADAKLISNSEIIEKVKDRLKENPTVIQLSNKDTLSSRIDILRFALCYTLEELGGSFCYRDSEGEYWEDLESMLLAETGLSQNYSGSPFAGTRVSFLLNKLPETVGVNTEKEYNKATGENTVRLVK